MSMTDTHGPILTPSFNRILVDSGYAEIDDFTNNEFTPDSWWSSSIAFAETTSKVTIPTALGPTTVTSSTTKKFVGSTKSDKYHNPSCRWAKKIKTENVIWFSPARRVPERRDTCHVGHVNPDSLFVLHKMDQMQSCSSLRCGV